MGEKTLLYQQKLKNIITESKSHLSRLNQAFDILEQNFSFPLQPQDSITIKNNPTLLAFCDQAIYRYSKLQDTMGAKLFRSLLLYFGENTNVPFLDILHQLEKMGILETEEWFILRDLRNEIAHNYEMREESTITIVNMIYEHKEELSNILTTIANFTKNHK